MPILQPEYEGKKEIALCKKLKDNKYEDEIMNVFRYVVKNAKKYQAKNGEIEALKNVNLKVQEGEFVSIIGPSGCGKSTLLSIIAGLEKQTSGEVLKKGEIGYMLQTDSLLPWRTIYKNVLFGLEIRKIKTLENEKYAQELLKKYNLFVTKAEIGCINKIERI